MLQYKNDSVLFYLRFFENLPNADLNRFLNNLCLSEV